MISVLTLFSHFLGRCDGVVDCDYYRSASTSFRGEAPVADWIALYHTKMALDACDQVVGAGDKRLRGHARWASDCLHAQLTISGKSSPCRSM